MWQVQLCEMDYGNEETSAVSDVIHSKWLTMGERCKVFEDSFAKFLGNDVQCSTVSSCTAALHLAIMSLDLNFGDEVVVPALTFVADANVVIAQGGTPVLADCVSLSNLNVDLDTIQRVVTKKTRAIIAVHFAGYPVDIKPLAEFCKTKNIVLIEDVAHAPGASVDNQFTGTFGDISCFSFFSNKNLSTGEGGMIATKDSALHQRFQRARSHGMTSLSLDRHKGRAASYDVNEFGLNYRMDEIRASLGQVQLEKLLENNLRREKIVAQYHKNLDDLPIMMPFSHELGNIVSAYHIQPIIFETEDIRNDVMKYMKDRKIQTSIHYPSIKNFKAYEHMHHQDTPIADEISKRELTIPLFPTMSEDQIHKVISCIRSYFI